MNIQLFKFNSNNKQKFKIFLKEYTIQTFVVILHFSKPFYLFTAYGKYKTIILKHIHEHTAFKINSN